MSEWACMRCGQPRSGAPLIALPDGGSTTPKCPKCGSGWWVPRSPVTYSEFGIEAAEAMLAVDASTGKS
jgi:hypothetical protein